MARLDPPQIEVHRTGGGSSALIRVSHPDRIVVSAEITMIEGDVSAFAELLHYLRSFQSTVESLEYQIRKTPNTPEGIKARRKLQARYFQITGWHMPGRGQQVPIEEMKKPAVLDEFRQELGREAKTGHLSEIEVRMQTRIMDESEKKVYDPNEPIDSQARRLGERLRTEAQTWPAGQERERMIVLGAELMAGKMTDRGQGSVAQVDEVLSHIPAGSGAGRIRFFEDGTVEVRDYLPANRKKELKKE